MGPSSAAVCQPSNWLKSSVERLSGNSLRGSDRAFLGSARRPKWYPFAPFRRLVRARNGASSGFPDSLSRNCLIIPGRAHYGPWRKPERVPKLPFRSLSWSPTRAPDGGTTIYQTVSGNCLKRDSRTVRAYIRPAYRGQNGPNETVRVPPRLSRRFLDGVLRSSSRQPCA